MRLPVQVTADQAGAAVLRKLLGGRCTARRLLHHPYAGFVFHIDYRVLGRRLHGDLRVLVDLRTGAVSTSEPWPEPPRVDGNEVLDAPPPRVAADEAALSARQCAMRSVLHRRLSLRHPELRLVETVLPLYKPNWLLTVDLPAGQRSVEVLVDGLTGGYHLLAGGRQLAASAANAG